MTVKEMFDFWYDGMSLWNYMLDRLIDSGYDDDTNSFLDYYKTMFLEFFDLKHNDWEKICEVFFDYYNKPNGKKVVYSQFVKIMLEHIGCKVVKEDDQYFYLEK